TCRGRERGAEHSERRRSNQSHPCIMLRFAPLPGSAPMRLIVALLAALVLATPPPAAQTSGSRVLTHREQAPLKHQWVEQRFKTILPALMRREGIDMWVSDAREYNADPVFAWMAPVPTYSSRRRTILVFFDRGGAVEHLSI